MKYSKNVKSSNSETAKRQCKNLGEVEDESHVLLSCPKYELDRKLMINSLKEAFLHLELSSDKDKFLFIKECNGSEVTLALSKMLSAIKRTRGSL